MNAWIKPKIDWEKTGPLVPVIIQNHQTAQVLMLGYMNAEALDKTCHTGEVIFYSRSKQRLWKKGETSGHVLRVVDLFTDCDEDSLLILVDMHDPCCHLNRLSCFDHAPPLGSLLFKLEALIVSREKERPANHYTTLLFEQGIKRIAQKVGEEGVEVALAACCGEKEEIINEASDLLYHLLVLLVAKQIAFSEVLGLLKKRGSGLDAA